MADDTDPTDPGPTGPRVPNGDELAAKRTARASAKHAGSHTGRIPPHDLDAERALLGAAMLAPAALDELAAVGPDVFYNPGHAHIAVALLEGRAAGLSADPTVIADTLRRRGVLDAIGGHMLLVDIMSSTPATSSAGAYARIVAGHAARRRVLGIVGEIAEAAYEPGSDLAHTLEHARQLVETTVTGATGGSQLAWADIAAVLAGQIPPVEASILHRNDGQALLYTGKMHVFQAEPGAAKSWLACQAVLEVLAGGGTAIYIDYEDSPRGIVDRLLALGGQPASLIDAFAYVRPDSPFGPAERLELQRRMEILNPDLIVLDGVAEALALDGIDEDRNGEVAGWIASYPRWLTDTSGAALIMIDHVVKTKGERGRYARGAGHKLAAIDGVAYELKVTEPFSRHRAGRVTVTIQKDRHGAIGEQGSVAAVAAITPHAAGERVELNLIAPERRDPSEGAWKPTRMMDRVAEEIARSAAPLDASQVVALLTSPAHPNPTLIRQAISGLLSDGRVRERREGHRTFLEVIDAPPPPTDPGPDPEVQSPLDEDF